VPELESEVGYCGSSVVIAEHYLAIQNPKPGWIGVVNTKSSPIAILESICKYVQTLCELNYGSYPDFIITGFTNTKFAYINVHMEVRDDRFMDSTFLWN
jgi:hypothetical protein